MLINIRPGSVLNNDDLQRTFLCSSQGGMRRSLRRNSLVLVSDHTKSLYEDRWEGEIFHYTGMGKVGHQDIDFHQNKTLAESNRNGVEVHLFEVFKASEYFYIGKMQLNNSPYQEDQLDEDLVLRKVWIFPLKALLERPLIPQDVIILKRLVREKIARRMTDNELAARAKHSGKKASRRESTGTIFERNPFVSEYAKRWAKGICQLCDNLAPFINKRGEPHLHTHHIDWLSNNGDDTIENTVAVCPNCHDKMHNLELIVDVIKLKNRVAEHLKAIMTTTLYLNDLS